MKVADLFGAGVPVLALDYGACLAERVRHGDNGLLFSTADQLASILFDLFEEFPGRPDLDRLRTGARKSARPTWDEGWTREARPSSCQTSGKSECLSSSDAASYCPTASGRRRFTSTAAGSPAVGGVDDVPAGAEVVDAGDLVVPPGLVDTHVHVNEPGRTEWEGFDTATRAAAAGGITTIVDMPLNSVPATTTRRGARGEARARRAAAATSTSASGAASCRATRGELERARRRRRARLQVLSVAVGRRRVPARRRGAICARRCRSSRGARRCRCSCTPSRRPR